MRIPSEFIFSFDDVSYYLYYDESKNKINMYRKEYILGLMDKLEKSDEDARSKLAVTLSKGIFEDLDMYNKILLPRNMREAVGPSRTVVLIGAFDHIEIMSKENYEQMSESASLTDVISLLKNKK